MAVISATANDRGLTLEHKSVATGWSALTFFLALQAVAWVIVPAMVWSAPHSNTLELALWSRDWFIVNYKHPALPAWLLAGGYALFGVHLWVSFALAELCIALAYVFVFLLGRDLLGTGAALFGTLLLPVVAHFTLDVLRYNHNVVQLPLWIGFCYGLWRASRSARPYWWVFTAAIAALGFYAKLAMAMIVAFGAVWLLIDPAARGRLRGRAPYVGLAAFVVLVAPLIVALIASRFQALGWITHESHSRGISGASFLRSVASTILVMAAAAAGGLLASRLGSRRSSTEVPAPIEPSAFFYVLFMGAGPLLLTLGISTVMRVRAEWASPMYSMLGLVLVALVIRLLPRQAGWAQADLRHAVLALAGSLAVLTSATADAVDDRPVEGISKRDWPAAQIADRFDRLWRDNTGRPLLIVGGDTWTAGIAGWMSAARPSLFVNLDPAQSTAITDARLRQQGMLVLWTAGSTWRPDPALIARYRQGSETFTTPVAPKAAPITIDYAIVAPGEWNR